MMPDLDAKIDVVLILMWGPFYIIMYDKFRYAIIKNFRFYPIRNPYLCIWWVGGLDIERVDRDMLNQAHK